MDIDRLTEEYVKQDDLLKTAKARQDELKRLLVEAVEAEGFVDDRGHKWLHTDRYTVQYQRRQGEPYLDVAAAEQWAKDHGFWDDVSKAVTTITLDEDAVVGYVYSHPELEDEFRQLYVKPKESWALLRPKAERHYEY